jgi:rhodanese-related sulfurtransferase
MSHLAHRLALVAGVIFPACGDADGKPPPPQSAEEAQPQPVEVDVAALKTARDAGTVVLVDVRSPAEFAEGHVPGAVNIPVDALQARVSELESYKKDAVYLICRSGARSGRAQGMLAAAGFSNPLNVAGGTLAWKSAGYPIE